MRLLASLFVVAAFAGCAQLQGMRPDAGTADAKAQPAAASVVDLVIPPDALGARDPQLGDVLAKVGAVAAKQPQPTTIVIAALAQVSATSTRLCDEASRASGLRPFASTT